MNRVNKNRDVQRNRPVLNIEKVEAPVRAEGRIVPRLALPEAGDAGAHNLATALQFVVESLDLGG
jgi:hypothetical protein